jgi:hypothetical protein
MTDRRPEDRHGGGHGGGARAGVPNKTLQPTIRRGEQMSQAGQWVTQGFEEFSKGTCGNAGQNLYVSRAGVLQRIHLYDLNQDGYVDLLFSNSQNHWEIPPAYLYRWPAAGAAAVRQEIRSPGATCATIADLNGDGHPDLIIGNWYDGVGFDTNATIYYGSDRGWGEHAVQYLPASLCSAVAAGDFNGDGRVDLALQCKAGLRLFCQGDLAFLPSSYTDLDIQADQLTAADLDGDGCADLVTRCKDGTVRIYWGSPQGLDAKVWTAVTVPGDAAPAAAGTGTGADGMQPYVEWVDAARVQISVHRLGKRLSLFVARPDAAWLVPVEAGRTLGEPLKIPCPLTFSLAIADLDGDGHPDLVLACRESNPDGKDESSWILWGGPRGKAYTTRTRLPSSQVCDVAVGDFDGDGKQEVALCQAFTPDSFTTSARLYRVTGREAALWTEVEAHDSRRAFAVPGAPGSGDALLLINRQGRSKLGNMPVYVYLGGPDGFRPDRRLSLAGWGATVSICADFNDDGRPDVAVANAAENSVDRDPGSYLYLQGPNGFPAAPAQILPTRRAHGIACADFDRDGYLDLALVGFNSDELLVFRGGPNGFDTASPQRIRMEIDGKVHKEPRFLCLADWNHDGWLDLFIPLIDSDYSLLLWGGPQGWSMERSQKIAARHACSARAADLDGDGYLDLIVGGHSPSATGPHDSFVYIYWNGPDGLREDRRTILPAEAVNSMSVADFNNDGNLDLFVGSYQDGRKKRDLDCYIYWNRGGRGFSGADFTRLFNHSASGDFAADFNNDGWVDIAVANHKTWGDHMGDSAVWWNGPDGFSEKRITWLPALGPHGMVVPGPGNVMDRSAEEVYVSAPHQLPHGAQPTQIAWTARVPQGTWVKAQIRGAATAAGLASARWLGPGGEDSWFGAGELLCPSGLVSGSWLQYRLVLGATNSGMTPRVTAVTVDYA